MTASNQAVRYTAAPGGSVIINNGLINRRSPPAAPSVSTIGAVLNATINNNAGGVIRSGDDAIQVAVGTVSSGQLNILNAGLIEATSGGQGLDLQGLATASTSISC